ncbi:MAG: 50S ribosomal protein L24 [Nitrosopumilaceae archaeon]|nr:50S ribosomal protein L24 [Nitrosopumilaceae archaeon]
MKNNIKLSKNNLQSLLSKTLRKKYKRRNLRLRIGDMVKVMRGEYKGVDGKILKILLKKSKISIEGIKRENSKGEKVNVNIHSSNVVITSINTDDKLRKNKLQNLDNNKIND